MHTKYLDILDQEGKKTGKVCTLVEAHELGLWHKSAHVWIVNSKKEILLQKRSTLVVNHPGEWDISAAGHFDAGEEGIKPALRELKEELGVKAEPSHLEFITEIKHTEITENYTDNDFSDIYVYKTDQNVKYFVLQQDEVDEVKWFPYKELKELIEKKDPNFVPHDEEYKILFSYINKL